jgi:hypothetical protein
MTEGPRWQKPIGVLAILVMIIVWCVGVASLSPWVARWPVLVQIAFYLVAGIAWLWVLPMRHMLSWMETGRWK